MVEREESQNEWCLLKQALSEPHQNHLALPREGEKEEEAGKVGNHYETLGSTDSAESSQMTGKKEQVLVVINVLSLLFLP